MREIKLNLSEGKDIKMQVPDDLEITTTEAFGIMAIEVQEQVLNGNIKINKRVWPCFYCKGKRDYSSQQKLLKHLETHTKEKAELKDKLKHLYEERKL